MQRSLPLLLEVGAGNLLARRRAGQSMGAPVGHATQEGESLSVRATAAQRRDQRLLYAIGALGGAQVAPALEGMGTGRVPAGRERGLVAEIREVDGGSGLGHELGELEVSRSVDDRVATEDEQRI